MSGRRRRYRHRTPHRLSDLGEHPLTEDPVAACREHVSASSQDRVRTCIMFRLEHIRDVPMDLQEGDKVRYFQEGNVEAGGRLDQAWR